MHFGRCFSTSIGQAWLRLLALHNFCIHINEVFIQLRTMSGLTVPASIRGTQLPDVNVDAVQPEENPELTAWALKKSFMNASSKLAVPLADPACLVSDKG